MADLAGLIEKVKVATGEDRVIDAQLAYIINYDDRETDALLEALGGKHD